MLYKAELRRHAVIETISIFCLLICLMVYHMKTIVAPHTNTALSLYMMYRISWDWANSHKQPTVTPTRCRVCNLPLSWLHLNCPHRSWWTLAWLSNPAIRLLQIYMAVGTSWHPTWSDGSRWYKIIDIKQDTWHYLRATHIVIVKSGCFFAILHQFGWI